MPLAAVVARHPKLDGQTVADVIHGCANQAGEDNRNVARMSALLADEAAAARHGVVPRERIVAMATAGVPPRIKGMGPAPATRKVRALAGLTLEQMDVIELNEAFAAQGLAARRDLGVADDDPRVYPNGGAIALGHPLVASRARLATTAVHQLD